MVAFGRGCRPKRMPGLRLIGSFKIAELLPNPRLLLRLFLNC